jgi:AGCS family alanine or glycine:cation symporter
MLDQFGHYLVQVADFICGYPLFFLLIGGGLYLFLSSGAISVRRLPDSIRVLREKTDHKDGQISSVQALLSAVAGTVGLGNIAGVAIALVMGGPGAIFWMWVSARWSVWRQNITRAPWLSCTRVLTNKAIPVVA